MRGVPVLVLSLGAAALLSGCGKKSEEPVMPTPQSAAPVASAAPAAPSADQQKMLAALPAPYNTADPVNGEAKFALCKSCHTITKGGPNLTGPNLYGVYGSKAASVAGFDFSDALKASGLTFDAPTLDKWINDPQSDVHGTKMTFAGVKDPKDRADIVAYVALQRDP
jgi:cytochrome c